MALAPAIGTLNTRLELIGIARVDDGAGGFTRNDIDVETVDAAVRPASANEIYRAEKLGQTISHMIVVRWRPDLMPARGMRGRWVDRAGRQREVTFETAHDPDEHGRFIVIAAREGAPK